MWFVFLILFVTQLVQLIGDEIEKSQSCRLSGVASVPVMAAKLHQLVIQVLYGAYLAGQAPFLATGASVETLRRACFRQVFDS